jgi:hypothetical protein
VGWLCEAMLTISLRTITYVENPKEGLPIFVEGSLLFI